MLVFSYVAPWLVAAALVMSAARGGDLSTAISTPAVVKILAQATRVFTLPLGAALWIAIYHDLKLRREGADLAVRAADMSGA